MRRALTLVETLGAIALLGAMAAVSAQWVTTALRISNETSGRIAWEQAAHLTLDLIARDLAVGDLGGGSGGEGSKAWIDDDSLVITTRVAPTNDSPGGATERLYALQKTNDTKRLVCTLREPHHRSGSSRQAEDNARILLGDLTIFHPEIIENEDGIILRITLTSRHSTLAREFEL